MAHSPRTIATSVATLALATFFLASCGAADAAKPKGASKPTNAASAQPAATSRATAAKGAESAPGVVAVPAAAPPAHKKRPLISKPTADEIAAIKAEGKKVAVIETARGPIKFELFDDDAPLTVANFVKLARAGFYDGLTFHRVVKEPRPFVIQGGDPLGNGMGNPGYTIEGEFSPTRQHLEGTVAMARSRDPNSAGCQFYICLAPAPELDTQYAIFGQVIEGMDAVLAVMQGDIMSRVTIEPAEEP